MSRGRRWIPYPGSGWAWAALSELHPRTGLVPILLDGLPGDSMRFDSPELAGLSHDRLRPWDSGEFYIPDDPREADGLDVGALVKEMWRDWAWMGEDDRELAEMRGPFTLEWPGLAPPGRRAADSGRAAAGPGRGADADQSGAVGRHRRPASAWSPPTARRRAGGGRLGLPWCPGRSPCWS